MSRREGLDRRCPARAISLGVRGEIIDEVISSLATALNTSRRTLKKHFVRPHYQLGERSLFARRVQLCESRRNARAGGAGEGGAGDAVLCRRACRERREERDGARGGSKWVERDRRNPTVNFEALPSLP
jgi:hypothetical protein